MAYIVYCYLHQLRSSGYTYYSKKFAFYAGMNSKVLAEKMELEKFLNNSVFSCLYETPQFNEGYLEEEAQNRVQYYASYLYEQLCMMSKELEGPFINHLSERELKVINDLKQALIILRFHFTIHHQERYTKDVMWYSNFSEADLSALNWLTVTDPKTWNYLPEPIIENILAESSFESINKKLAQEYKLSANNYWNIIGLFEHIAEGFKGFNKDVYLSANSFDMILRNIKDWSGCYQPCIRERSKDIVEISFEQVVTSDFVKLQLVFQKQYGSCECWRLIACTRLKEGYYIKRRLEQDPIFNGCDSVEFRIPSGDSVVYFTT